MIVVDEILPYFLLPILIKICYKRDPQNVIIFVRFCPLSAHIFLRDINGFQTVLYAFVG